VPPAAHSRGAADISEILKAGTAGKVHKIAARRAKLAIASFIIHYFG